MADSNYQGNIVVVGLIERDSRIFIAKRADTKKVLPGIYELPGGHVEPDESLGDAIRRELKEELQVSVEIVRLVDAFTYESGGKFKVELCYLCQHKQEVRLATLRKS
jgi:8-oxo-dGTP diphosphatase